MLRSPVQELRRKTAVSWGPACAHKSVRLTWPKNIRIVSWHPRLTTFRLISDHHFKSLHSNLASMILRRLPNLNVEWLSPQNFTVIDPHGQPQAFLTSHWPVQDWRIKERTPHWEVPCNYDNGPGICGHWEMRKIDDEEMIYQQMFQDYDLKLSIYGRQLTRVGFCNHHENYFFLQRNF